MNKESGVKTPHYMRGRDRFYPCPLCNEDHVSTTTVLDVIGSPALVTWASKVGTAKLKLYNEVVKELAPEVEKEAKKRFDEDFWLSGWEQAKKAADYGTMAHAGFEMHLKGHHVDIKALPEPSRKAFGVFEVFANENQIETLDTEKTFYNCRMGYAGTADWRGYVNGMLTMADWKTSSGLFDKFIVQAWANAISDEMQHGDRLYQQIMIGRFGKDGSTDILICGRNGQITLNGKAVESDGHFGSYEQSRELIQACVPWFHYKKKFELVFPYKKKEEKKS